jgi:ribosome-binding protein aMBF1 (putative translation factor)
MQSENAKDKLNTLAAGESSNWLEKAEWSQANEAWLNKSADIALKVLRALREKGMTQKDLAEKLNVSPQQVSKMVKGKENLTLETISKLEYVLGVALISTNPTGADTKLAADPAA